MKNLETTRLKLTESQLLHIKDRIKNWRTKDQEASKAYKESIKLSHTPIAIIFYLSKT